MDMFSFIPQDQYESCDYPSTAPSTPNGSLTFSPVLRPSPVQDALDSAMAPGFDVTLQSLSLDLESNPSECIRNICCIGAGYVGGPTSSVIAFCNPHIHVNVADRDFKRIASWQSRHLPIHEDGLHDIVRVARDGAQAICLNSETEISDTCSSSNNEGKDFGRDGIYVSRREPNLFFTTDVARSISEADLILITVNTPTKSSGIGAGRATNVSALESVTREIALHARPGTILVEKSTVPCGTSQMIKETLAIHRPGVAFEVLSNPEFLAEGSAIHDLLYPDRVVIGSTDTREGLRAATMLADVYATWVPRSRIVTVNVWSSELAKLVANAMLAQRISSINSISAICENTGADINEIARSVGLDSRIGPQFLQSGVGFGGSCFKKDILSLIYLAESLNLNEVAQYWQQVLLMNEFQRDRFSRRIINKLNNTLAHKKITILGYAFKRNTSDTRETPAIEVIRTLLVECPLEIAIYDPCCDPNAVKSEISCLVGASREPILMDEGGVVQVYTDVYKACNGSNVVIILTDWEEFRNAYGPDKLKSKHTGKNAVLVDPRPFSSLPPSETQLWTLHKYLTDILSSKSQSLVDNLANSYGTVTPATYADNPLGRYLPVPICKDGCRECLRCEVKFSKRNQQLDWVRVSDNLRSPKWVFDGRGILDISALEGLGVRVESIGRMNK